MQGLQALMQRGLMPGQSGAFSALPQQQGRNPIEYTRSLKQIPPEDLIRLYNDPNDLRPKWAVASAYADAMKARALQRGVQGQQAMAQNAQQQQQLPVADEVMSVMAANGGLMKSYADGGAINFDIGGSSVYVPASLIENPDYDKDGNPRSPVEKDSIIRQNAERIRAYKEAQENKDKGFFERLGKDEPLRRVYEYFQKPSEQREPILDAFTGYIAEQLGGDKKSIDTKTAADVPSQSQASPPPQPNASSSAGALTDSAQGAATPGPSASPRAGLSAVQDMVNYRKLMEDQYKTLTEEMRKSAKEPEDIKAGSQKIAALRAAQIEQAQEDARRIRETGVARLQKMLDSARAPVINDPRALFAIAASINPEKGKLFSSLSSGIEAVLADRAARAEKAEQGIETLSDKIRLLNSQYREAKALEEERQQALRVRNYEKARDLEIRIQQLGFDMRKTQATLQIGEMEAGAKQEAAGASREAANATRQANLQNRVTIALQNRQNAFQKAKEDWSKGTDVKLAAMKASSPNAKEEDVKRWEDMQKAFETEFRNSSEIMALDAAIARMSQEAGIPAPISRSDWGQKVKVTDTPKQ